MISRGFDSRINYSFPETKNLIINNVSNKFLYKNLYRSLFPVVEKLYTNSNPYDISVLHRFSNDKNYICYLESYYYEKYLNRWWYPETKYIKKISEYNYSKNIINYKDIFVYNK